MKPDPKVRPKRCAIYTRKSSEEGLEQEFNSLHAQQPLHLSQDRAFDIGGWQKLIEAGKYASVREAARAEGLAKSYAARVAKMMLLAPEIVGRSSKGGRMFG